MMVLSGRSLVFGRFFLGNGESSLPVVAAAAVGEGAEYITALLLLEAPLHRFALHSG